LELFFAKLESIIKEESDDFLIIVGELHSRFCSRQKQGRTARTVSLLFGYSVFKKIRILLNIGKSEQWEDLCLKRFLYIF